MSHPENQCAAAGCSAACCQNISLELSQQEAMRFIDGQRVHHINVQDLQVSNLDEIPSIPSGINIIENPQEPSAAIQIYIRGACPYLNPSTMDCTIYRQKKRPGICSEVNIGHYTCDIQRIRSGRVPVKSLTRV